MKAYKKDILKKIKTTFNRYLSIIAIVALGVALYVGINSSSPDMEQTLDKYYQNSNMFDIHLLSTVGFNDEDINLVKSLEDIKQVNAVKSIDTIVRNKEKDYAIKITSIPQENIINKYELVEGREIENDNEILLDYKMKETLGYELGDTIELLGDGKEDNYIEDTFSTTKYSIVGFINSPLYISQTRGSTTIGNGTVSGFAYVSENAFSLAEYTNIYIALNLENKNKTSDEYLNEVEEKKNKIEGILDKRAEEKKAEIYEEAQKEISDGEKEIQDAKAELEDAKTQIENAKIEISNNEIKLKQEKENYNIEISNNTKKIEDAESTLNETKKQLDSKAKELEEGFAEIELQKESIEVSENKILENSGFKTLDGYLAYLKTINKADEQILGLIQNIEQLITGKQELQKQEEILNGYKNELNDGILKYEKGVEELQENKQALENGISTAESQFKQAENKIANAKQELESSEKEFLEEEPDALEKIANAEKDIDKAKEGLEDLKVKIYTLNIETNEGYISYTSDVERVLRIGKVFPVLFFLVAALVSLTAMTRMVEEDRNDIGTYKSLGYSRFKIMLKYIIYCASATMFGIVIGVFAGSYTFPYVVAEAYRILYPFLPTVIMSLNPGYIATAGVAAFLSTIIATVFACYKELRTTPAYLMRPKAPKQGKKIFLEKIPFLWKYFSFTQKITARNVFRYKKRLFMTIIGIAGCTALIFVGFGLRDSIANIINVQYGQIRKHDFEITLKQELDESEREELNSYIKEKYSDSEYIYLRQQSNDVGYGEAKKQNAYIVAVDNQEELKKFVNIRNRKTKEKIEIPENGVVITEKLSKLLNIKAGDNIEIYTEDDTKAKVKVTGIAENYIYHYIYMNKNTYKQIFNEDVEFNQLYLKTEKMEEEKENELSGYLLKNDKISQISNVSTLKSNFANMIGSLDFVVIVLILCAALLAFVVLYNLNSINIAERKRELATIKLLGFYNNELANYVYRENIILTILGAMIGLVLGIYMHMFIISTAELDMFMFARYKSPLSYVYAFIITIIFALITNLIMSRTIKKIDMIESLKSVE